jgi:hypothetical protein
MHWVTFGDPLLSEGKQSSIGINKVDAQKRQKVKAIKVKTLLGLNGVQQS